MKQRIPQSEILEIKAYPQLRNKDMQEDIISTEFATYVTDFVFSHGICIFCYKVQTLNVFSGWSCDRIPSRAASEYTNVIHPT